MFSWSGILGHSIFVNFEISNARKMKMRLRRHGYLRNGYAGGGYRGNNYAANGDPGNGYPGYPGNYYPGKSALRAPPAGGGSMSRGHDPPDNDGGGPGGGQGRTRDILKRLRQYTTPIEQRYSPNFGYEPYWEGGDWILEDFERAKEKATSKKVVKICGDDCPYMYREVGQVCTLYPYNDPAYLGHSCGYYHWHFNCYGYYDDKHDYRTFPTYCEFLDKKCKLRNEKFGRIIFIHVGKCLKDEEAMLEMRPEWLTYDAPPMTRLSTYITGIYNRFVSYNVTTDWPFYDYTTTT